jgi:hypothetical protein
VVSIAQLSPHIFGIWSLVHDALAIVDVAILPSTAMTNWVRWIDHVNKDESGTAAFIVRHCSDGIDEVRFFIDNHVMRRTGGQFIAMASQVYLIAKNFGVCWVDIQ